MVSPAKGSGIGAVEVGTTDDFYTTDFMTRLRRMFNPVPRDTSLRPLTSLDEVMSVNPRDTAAQPFVDMFQGKGGFIPRGFGISKFTGDADTVGGELLQGLGNIGIDALEALRLTGGIPVAAAMTLGTETLPAYERRMRSLARNLDEQTRMQQGQLGTGFNIDEPTSIVGGPSYQQTPTDVDQDAAIRSQIRQAQDITEEQGIFGDITDDGRRPGMGVPDFVGGVPSAREEISQAMAASEADDGDFTESGRRGDLTAGDDTDEGVSTTVTDGSNVKGADSPAKQAAASAIDDVLKQVKPDAKPLDYDDYLKEFADLTGLDVSGQPDNSQALMAFGLALMQNKAGKGFNVGQILSEVGAAGEKALPAISAARQEAKQTRIKAAEFAISRKKEDQAKALNKDFYYVVPKGGKGFVSNFDKGELKRFNSQELFNLDQNKEFQDQFEIIPMSTYEKIAKEIFKTPEYGEKYASSYDKISLFTDAPADLQIGVQRTNANYKGPDMPERGYFDVGQYETYANRLKRADQSLDAFGKQLATAYTIVDSGAVTTGGQISDAISDFSAALGITHPSGASNTARVKRILNVVAAKKAPEILQEAGKTISDADRARVQEIVGRLGMIEPAENLKLALKDMYDFIVIDGKKDIRDGIATLNQYAGVKSPTRTAKMVDGKLVIQ